VTSRLLAATAAVLPLAGCLWIPTPDPELARGAVEARDSWAEAAPGGVVGDGWLAELGDPALGPLVEEALAHNPDLAVAAARWDEARALLRVAGALLQPRLDGFAGSLRSDAGESPPASRHDLGLQVGWEPDLWGRLRADRAAAVARAAASRGTWAFARQSLAAAVAEAWFLALAANRQLAIQLDLVQAERFIAEVTRDKIDVGAASRLEADVAEANLALAEDAVAQGEAAVVAARHALEILLGRYPAAEIDVQGELPGVPPVPPAGIPSELLERRPDIVAAEQLVAAAFHDVTAARAARLPRVLLTASLGTLLDPRATIWSIGADLLAPLYTGGELEGRVDAALARGRAALARYVATARAAFREVEASLANERLLALRQRQLELASERLRSASGIAEDRYRAGIIGILDLTQVRRQDFDTRAQLVRVRSERLRQRIRLHLALGGSFTAAEAAP
jgi:NodT family efflux transporter outer membrane factor (OMF) lipoprotein